MQYIGQYICQDIYIDLVRYMLLGIKKRNKKGMLVTAQGF